MMRSLLLVSLIPMAASVYYLPGVNHHVFQEGEETRLKVNKLTSTATQFPMDYYKFPFCQPPWGPRRDNQNLGEFLAGDSIESSPYVLMMKKDMYCEQVCISNLGPGERPKIKANKVVRAIRKGYRNNWIVDNLSAASKMEDDRMVTTKFWGGFPVGFIAEDNKKAYIHNHVNIELFYHAEYDDDEERRGYSIVRFIVHPLSIRHNIDQMWPSAGELPEGDSLLARITEIVSPIPSCDPSIPYANRPHTTYEFVKEEGREPQEASGKVLFTYDVIWTEDANTKWSNRWDVYLDMNGEIPVKPHWQGIVICIFYVCVLAGVLMVHIIRNLRDDVARANDLATEEEEGNADVVSEGSGWMRAYSSIFLPPRDCPRLFAVACGSGAQILMTTILTLFFAQMGYFSAARRGKLVTAICVLYPVTGGIHGYVTARLLKTFFGRDSQHSPRGREPLLFPGMICGVYFIFNLLFWYNGTTLRVPFTALLVLLFLLLAVHYPLASCGAALGHKHGAIEFIASSGKDTIPHPIPPEQPWFVSFPFTVVASGLLFWPCCHFEVHCILDSIWNEQYYYSYGFLSMLLLLVLVICSQVTVCFLYLQLKHENYDWWWQAFANGGSWALHGFFFSLRYLPQYASFSTLFFFFVFMALVCLAVFCMLGFVGVVASLCFHKAVYASVSVKLGYALLLDKEDDSEVQMQTVEATTEKVEAAEANNSGEEE